MATEPLNTQSAGSGSAAQQASGSNVRQMGPQEFSAYAPAGGLMLMTYNPSTVTRGAKGQPGTQGMLTTQRFDGPGDANGLRAAIAKMETGKGNRGDQVRLAVDGQGWNEATPAGPQALDMLRQALKNWTAGSVDAKGTTPPSAPAEPAPPPGSPHSLPRR